MKHIIKKFNGFRAGCSRPGCITNLEGGIVDEMKQKDLNNFFKESDCPGVWANGRGSEMTYDEKVSYLLKRAKQEIKDWQLMIEYWENIK